MGWEINAEFTSLISFAVHFNESVMQTDILFDDVQPDTASCCGLSVFACVDLIITVENMRKSFRLYSFSCIFNSNAYILCSILGYGIRRNCNASAGRSKFKRIIQ